MRGRRWNYLLTMERKDGAESGVVMLDPNRDECELEWNKGSS